MKTTIKKHKKTNEDVFTVSTSIENMNYDEESLAFLSFHTTRNISVLLNEKELEKLIEKLTETKNFLNEKNKIKNIK